MLFIHYVDLVDHKCIRGKVSLVMTLEGDLLLGLALLMLY